jgi:ABC-2 type transport system ATP-binding protein
MHDNKAISCTSITKSYANFLALDSLTMDVVQGDIFGFLGPNGAGKTTTIRILCGLLSPSSGGAKVAGLDIVKESQKIKKIIGLVPESSGYYYWMNAEEYLLYFASLYKIEPYLAKHRTRNLLEIIGLAEKSHVPISYYSRGMKQRLGLARALINEPQIVFLDEPTLGLDPVGQQEIQRILLELNHEKDVTIFLSSHALSEVSCICNRIAIVDRGILIAQGGIGELRDLVGGKRGVVVRILYSMEAEKSLIEMGYSFEINVNGNDKVLDVFCTTKGNNKNDDDAINEIINEFNEAGLKLYEIRRFEMSLEEIFFKLTGTFEDSYTRRNTLFESDVYQKNRRPPTTTL